MTRNFKTIFFILSFVAVLIPHKIIGADASIHSQDEEIRGYVKTYCSFLGKPDFVGPIKSPQEAFQSVATLVGTLEGDIFHNHIKSAPAYGKSFRPSTKNAPTINYISKLLTGQMKQWPKAVIEGGIVDINIADIGSGLGFTVVGLVSQVMQEYNSTGWKLAKQINIDLFDVNSEHQDALLALANLINLAYPNFFKIRSFVYDITELPTLKDHYRIIFALNVMHYIPKGKWLSALSSLREMMTTGAMLLLTTDHYRYVLCPQGLSAPEGKAQDSIEETVKTLCKQQAVDDLADCFKKLIDKDKFLSTITVYAPPYPMEKGVLLANYEGDQSFVKDQNYIPGKTYELKDIIPESLFKVVKTHYEREFEANDTVYYSMLGKHIKPVPPITIGMWDGHALKRAPLEQWQQDFMAGKILVYAGNYAFDNAGLQVAIERQGIKFKILKSSWIEELGDSAGIMLTKLAKQ